MAVAADDPGAGSVTDSGSTGPDGGGAEPDAAGTDGAAPSENAARGGFEIAGDGELCAPCGRSGECGGDDDLCVINAATNEAFCGTFCQVDSDCPDEFHCTDVRRAEVRQCVPNRGICPDRQQNGVANGAGGSP